MTRQRPPRTGQGIPNTGEAIAILRRGEATATRRLSAILVPTGTVTLFGLARTGRGGRGGAFMEALPINVGGASAAALFDLGFAPPVAKLFFILGRTAGLTARVHQELTRAADAGKSHSGIRWPAAAPAAHRGGVAPRLLRGDRGRIVPPRRRPAVLCWGQMAEVLSARGEQEPPSMVRRRCGIERRGR